MESQESSNEMLVVDCLVRQDGENPSFYSYMNYEEALRIQQCGLSNAERVFLRETVDRPVSNLLKEGVSEIVDI